MIYSTLNLVTDVPNVEQKNTKTQTSISFLLDMYTNMPTIQIVPRHNFQHTRRVRKPTCVQATIVVMANKKHSKNNKHRLTPKQMKDPVLDGLPVLFHDDKTSDVSFTKWDMSVPPLEKTKKRKPRKRKRKSKKIKNSFHEYLKSFSISE